MTRGELEFPGAGVAELLTEGRQPLRTNPRAIQRQVDGTADLKRALVAERGLELRGIIRTKRIVALHALVRPL